jgi:hypothetical protein
VSVSFVPGDQEIFWEFGVDKTLFMCGKEAW